jgi:hypothetical protein
MAEKPTNLKLWTMVVFQAKTKYNTYPSPGASAWVHQHYIELGGKFEDSTEHTHRRKMAKAAFERKLKERQEQIAKRKHEGKGKHEEK